MIQYYRITKALAAGIVTMSIAASMVVMFACPQANAQQSEFLTRGLFLKRHGFRPGVPDPVMMKIVEGKTISAREGESVTFSDGKSEKWTGHGADSTGWFRGEYAARAYGYFEVTSDRERTVLLESYGDDMVYVNGVPREGNKYAYKDKYDSWEPAFDFSIIPIELRKGTNEFLFVCNRGVLKAKLGETKPQVMFNSRDLTLPDLLVGKNVDDYAGVVVVNATHERLENAVIRVKGDSGLSGETRVPLIQPMSLRQVKFRILGPPPAFQGTLNLGLELLSGSGRDPKRVAQTEFPIRVVPPSATHNVTFISDIDSSVQYYAIVPPLGPDDGKPKALFLSLHGADVIATNMARSYFPKTWGYIVCPTNGRPYGFDWEDWGRLDALQVLGIAESTLNIDPNRVYLTGHSMGGHGTWIIGAQYPDKFAAIGPSAGWISWWTYVRHRDSLASPIERMLGRATMPVHTYALDQNYKQLGVYILQGSKDDNVPVSESINMADTLSKFHKDFIFHEQMGEGHWWSLGDEAGADCVDWSPMFDFFSRHARPGMKRIENLDFTTANPGVSSTDYWLTIYAQEKQLEPSRAVVRFNPSRNRFDGTTDNVRIISFNLGIVDRSKPLIVELDSTTADSISVMPGTERIWLEKGSGRWNLISCPSPALKGPDRYGTFKDAFRHDVVFVYGTHGSEEENRWAFYKARFDGEYFWYQGNGSIDIVSDREFDPSSYTDRNVILYGNEKTNSAWDKVVDDSQVKVTEGGITLGGKTMKGNGYACLMVRPRLGSNTASVGVVSGTGIDGMRLTESVPYLEPGFGLPDLTILDARPAKKGLPCVKSAGFFGLDWSVKNGEIVGQ